MVNYLVVWVLIEPSAEHAEVGLLEGYLSHC